MFQDQRHLIELVNFKSKRYLKKTISNKDFFYLLKKEYEIENILTKKDVTPKVFGLNKHFFCEEFIVSKKIILNRDFLFKIANAFRRIHNVNLNKFTTLKNDFIKDKKYCLYFLYKKIINNAPVGSFNKEFIQKLDYLIKFYEFYLNKKKLSFCLIHGDLSPKNILLDAKGNTKVIDWVDARIDLPSHDIVQFFYLFKLNKKQQKMFLKFYGDFIYDEIVFDMHLTMLWLYDFVDFWLKHRKENKDKINKIIAKIKKYEKNIMFCSTSR